MTKKIIVDYSGYGDAELDTTANAGIKSTTGNAAFTFTKNELTDATTALSNYHTALSLVATGNAASVTNKNTAKAALVAKLNTLCSSINLQANSDLAKSQSTGFPLAKDSSHQTMDLPINFVVNRGKNAGEMDLSVDKPPYTDHGTVFAFWDTALGATPDSPDKWFQRSCNGHSLTIKGLKPGVSYPFASAYKGADSDALVWSSIITKMAGD